MPIGGKLVLKGGETLGGGVKKKKKKSKKAATAEGGEGADGGKGGVKQSQQAYEKEFEFEEQRRAAPKIKNTPWGSSYTAPPEILHGYNRKVTGENAEERLDLRCATKADKFCK